MKIEELKGRLKEEAAALFYTFVPVQGNDTFKKIIAVILFVFWCFITGSKAYGLCETDDVWYIPLTAFVFLLAGKLWQIEFYRRSNQ